MSRRALRVGCFELIRSRYWEHDKYRSATRLRFRIDLGCISTRPFEERWQDHIGVSIESLPRSGGSFVSVSDALAMCD